MVGVEGDETCAQRMGMELGLGGKDADPAVLF